MEARDRERLERHAFKYGKRLIGQNGGGLLVRLFKAKGLMGGLEALDDAAVKENPREYIGAMFGEKSGEKVDMAGVEKPAAYKCPVCWQWYPDKCECGEARA